MKVLIADDDELTRVYLKKLLSSWGYQVVLAARGDEAWKVLTDSVPPQIAVLDWVMPGKTGVEICSECQREGLPVYRILLTSKEKDEDMMYALDQGAHDFQRKPIVPGVMKSRIAVGKRLIEAMQEVTRSERLAAVGSLVTGVAHHFNNLNMPILMYASSILKDADLNQNIRKKVEKIEKAAEQAGALTEKLMSIASNKTEKRKLVDLNKLVSDSLEISSVSFEKDAISVETDLGSIPHVSIVENDIHHVVLNLLKNASDAMVESREKKIRVSTGLKKEQIFLRITDTGCGIAADKLQKLFSPFFTEKGEFAEPDSPLSKVKGAGIGLYASKNIAADHSGKITVESDFGEGATFTLWMPVAQEGDVNPAS